jgi:hypothetical protein
MRFKNDFTGQRFGRLEVICRDSSAGKQVRWICKCDCGESANVESGNLKKGFVRSCGCLRREMHTSHGMAGTKVYSAWRQMRQRCENAKDASFNNYGARGVFVVERWQSFANFFEDMGYPPRGGTLDRIDNDGPYGPGNCRWATWKEQHSNKRTNRVIEAFGKSQTLQEWADEYALPLTTLRNRLDRGGWSIVDALTKPAMKGRKP